MKSTPSRWKTTISQRRGWRKAKAVFLETGAVGHSLMVCSQGIPDRPHQRLPIVAAKTKGRSALLDADDFRFAPELRSRLGSQVASECEAFQIDPTRLIRKETEEGRLHIRLGQ